MKIKVKNILNKDIKIKLVDNSDYLLKLNEEKIVGEYDDTLKNYIFNLLFKGLEVCKIENDNVKDYMKILPEASIPPESKIINNNDIINESKIKTSKKRGRPPKKA